MILTEFMAVLLGLWHFWVAIYGAISPDKLGYGLIRAPKRLCGSRNFSWHWQPFFMPWKEISNYDMLLTLWKWQRITQYKGIPARFSFDTLTNPAKQPKLRACSSTTKLQKRVPEKNLTKHIFWEKNNSDKLRVVPKLFLYFPWTSSQVFFPAQKWGLLQIPLVKRVIHPNRMGACKPTSNCWWCNPLYPYSLQNKGLQHVKPWSLKMPYLDPLIISYNSNTSPANGVIRSPHLNYLVYHHKPHSLSNLANFINCISKTDSISNIRIDNNTIESISSHHFSYYYLIDSIFSISPSMTSTLYMGKLT